jgi:hypothetical protein
MKAMRAIDVVGKALNHNTAITLITTFGTKNSVMVFNASTNQYIATVHKLLHENGATSYSVTNGLGNTFHSTLNDLRDSLEAQPGFPRGASKSRNYSRPVLKEGVVL